MSYNALWVLELNGTLNFSAFKKAFHFLEQKYAMLGAKLISEKEQAAQVRFGYLKDSIDDLSNINSNEQSLLIRAYAREVATRLFDHKSDLLIRARFIKLRQHKYMLMLALHPLILDERLLSVITKDLSYLYDSYSADKELILSLLQDEDTLALMEKIVQESIFSQQPVYWKNQILNMHVSLELPRDSSRHKESTYQGFSALNYLSHAIKKKLNQFSQEHQVSLSMILLGVFQVLLYRYTGQEDVTVGVPIESDNDIINGEDIGPSLNVFPLRTVVEKDDTFVGILKKIKKTTHEVYQNQGVHFEELLNNLSSSKNLDLSSFFQAMFIDQDVTDKVKLSLKDIQVRPLNYPLAAQCDLTLYGINHVQGIELKFEYSKDLFEQKTIEELASHFIELMQEILRYPEKTVRDLSFLTSSEKHKLLIEWNDTKVDYLLDKTIHHLFEEQAEKTPGNIAIVYEDQKITYQQLNEKANQLAHYLKSQGVEPGTLIGISIERSIEMIIGLLAILKTGSACVPLDPTYPQERLQYMLEDTKSPILITQDHLKGRFKDCSTRTISLQLDSEEKNLIIKESWATSPESWVFLSSESFHNPESISEVRDLAYVIYTSGSTGKPKGVLVEHYAMLNRCSWMWNKYPFREDEITCHKTSLNFVDSIWEIFGPLLKGIQLIIIPQEVVNDPHYFLEYLQKKRVTRLLLVPSLLDTLISYAANSSEDYLKYLRLYIVSGEALSPALSEKFLKTVKNNVMLLNLYGSTEIGADVTYYEIVNGKGNEASKSIIGKPISNIQIYILDERLNLVPVGVKGEIYVGGAGLARGYLNRPDWTEERFIPNPFINETTSFTSGNKRLYRTGDLARYFQDGNIEFLGRMDDQVKIRGFRIELGEIESVLVKHEYVSRVLITAREDGRGDKNLVAYVVLKSEQASSLQSQKSLFSSSQETFSLLAGESIPLLTETLRNHLALSLPSHMIPAFFVYIDKLPLTPNGKIDRKSLPAPDLSLRLVTEQYVPPRTDLEKSLASIWSEVLKINQIGIYDNFFKIGGHSLLAAQVVSRIRNLYQMDVPLRLLFKEPTISSMAVVLDSDMEQDSIPSFSPIVPQERSKLTQLSFAQQRLWFIEEYEGGTNAYNIPMFFKLPQEIDLGLLRDSLNKLLTRHEVLRSIIIKNEDGAGYQEVLTLDKKPLNFRIISVENINDLHDKFVNEVEYIYKLDTEYPIRVCFYDLKSTQEYYLSIMIHHIAFDGWSIPIFIKELNALYADLNLPEIKIQYQDFAIWQKKSLAEKRLEVMLAYWSNKLADYETLNLLTDFSRPLEVTYRGNDVKFTLGIELSSALRELAKNLGVSLYSVLLSAYVLMLRAYCNQDDIVLGTTFANRHFNEIEDLIGFFVNALPLRFNVDPTIPIKDFIINLSHDVIDAQTYQDLPFEKLVDALRIEKDLSRHPIFQVVFEVDSFSLDQDQNSILKPYEPQAIIQKVAQFDLNTRIDDTQVELKGVFNYATSLFTRESIEGFITTYKHILVQFSENISRTIKDLAYLTPSQYQTIVKYRNSTEEDYPIESSLAELFETQVQKHTDRIAVVDQDTKLTYGELNERVNKLAHYLRTNYQLNPDTLIIVIMDRSINLLVSMLAIFKSGAAYLPIDPIMPVDRMQAILDECGAIAIITEHKYASVLEQLNNPLANILVLDEMDIDHYNDSNLGLKIQPHSLAYVIYTSGSTGKPKGAMVENKGMINHLYIKIMDMGITANDKVAQTATQSFDVSVWQFVSALLVGGTTVVFKGEAAWQPEELLTIMDKENVTIFQTVPSHMYAILPVIEKNPKEAEKFKSLRWIMINGEPLLEEICTRWFQVHPNIPIINAYGPTECSDDVTHFKIYPETIGTTPKVMPINGTLGNTHIYITDDNLTPLPIGAIGELIIGGIGVGRGYLNRGDLTLEKFIPNPFQTEEEKADKRYSNTGRNDKLYRTGDLVRYLHNGQIEYISRKDFQVKIRGYRIELGEIESALMNFEGIKQSVVLVQTGTGSSKHLVGYYVADKELDNDSIKEHLKSKLPEYMVPNALVYLEELPLTLNGKLNRKGLPKADFADSNNYKAPRNDLEMKICGIWGEVLGLEVSKVGIRDDFFRLGGDSIVSIQLVSRLRQRLNLQVNVKDIFGHRNIENLVDNVLSKNIKFEVVQVKTEQGLLTGEFGLLPIQEWFFAEAFEVSEHWNQSFLIKTPALDLERLQVSLDQLVQYHDSFRLRFKGGKQYYADTHVSPKLQVLDVRSVNDLQEHLTSWQSGFNLGSGPVASFGYLYGFDDGSARVYFALHHLIVDTVSWRILTKDLQALYEGKPLGDKGSSYRQWVEAINHYKGSSDYCWDSVFADYDKERLIRSSESHSIEITLNKDQTSTLLRECGKAYNTQINDLLLSALGRSLPHVTGSEVNHIVLEGHGREEIDLSLDVSGTLGWFTTMYPVRLEARSDIGSMIKQIKEMLRGIPYHGIGYKGELPYISFNYLGQFDASPIHSNWSIVDEKSGLQISQRNHARNIIDINGWVIDGELKLTIEAKLSEDKVSQLTRVFKNSLLDVIEHTVTQKMTQLTVSDVNFIIGQEYLDRLQSKKEIQGVYLANSLQQGFIYHSLSQGDVDDAYIVQVLWEYHTALDIDLLKKAWELAQVRFSTLRLRFGWEEELVQVVDTQGCLDWRYRDLSTESDDLVREESIKKVQQEDRQERYDLSKGPLFRVHLIKEREDKYRCILSNHHAILDGWSNPILLSFVHDVYVRLLRGETVIVDVDQSYVNAQQYLQVHKKDHKDYWSEQIARLDDRVDLSGLCTQQVNLYDYKHIKTPSVAGIVVSGRVYEALKKLCHEEGITLNAITQYVWHKILSVYGYSEKTIVGTIASGRNLPVDDIDRSVGLYINTLPLIVDHSKSQRVIDQLKEIQHDINEINIRSSIDLGSLQQGGERLFTTLFVFENYPDQIKNNGLAVTFGDSIEKLDYPLGVLVYEEDGKLLFKIQYAGELFSSDTINTLLSLANNLIEQIVYNADQLTSELDYLTSSDAKKILEDWNKTEQEYRSDKTIAELFEEQVERTPDSVAVVYNDIRLTYKELNTKANQLAHYLRAHHDVKAESLVALCLERSEFMIISILGILKAGGAYVPIDPSYPRERIDYILEDTKSIFTIDEMFRESHQLEDYPTNNLAVERDSSNLAYVIYTSGSTGHPKGVMIEQKSVVNLAEDLTVRYNLQGKESILLFANIMFDASVEQMMLALFNGHKLVVIDSDLLLNDIAFCEYLNIHKVTHVHVPPVFLTQFNLRKVVSLRRLISGGDVLSKETYSRIADLNKSVAIINEYGPTETTITATTNVIKGKELFIGRPVANMRAYILDSHQKVVPVGAIGELYLAGVGLARGYLNNSNLTLEKFIPNPFQTEEEKADKRYSNTGRNDKLYRTGDLVRYLHNGQIEYISRKDFQVKIRGYRIELGEIESALMNFEGIKQSVVLVQTGTGSSKHLVGYYVADKELDNDSIKEHLKSKLPEYMVPNALVYLEELPLTLNGKLNRKGLPKADFADSNNYKAPRNDLEMKICGIWGEVLGLEVSKVGIRDDFFRLGGDSIVSIQLVSRLRQRLNLQVNVKDIFGHRNIENLVDNVLSKNIKFEVVQVKTEQGLLTGEFGLLPIQEWFFAEAFEVSEHWNQSFLIKTPALDLERLQVSLDQLVQYHDSFRLRFKGGKQYYADTHVSPKLQVLDVRSVNDLQEHLTSWQSGFNLGSGPVASFGYLYGFDDGSARVYFALHHLIVDTVSWRILTKDLQALYEGKPLGDKGSSYRQWVEAINHYKGSSDYCWDSVFADYDKERLIRSSESHSIEITLNKDQTSTLLRECGKAYNTQINDLLLSALGRSLPHVTGSEVNHIVLEGHGREEIDLSLDVSGTLGWFTTMYPVRLEARSDIGSMIKQIKEMLRGIPYHGIGYKGELPYISFNYLGQFDASPIHSNWSIVDEKSGLQISQRNHARNIIDINGWVIDGELKLTIEAKLSEDKVSQLTRVFKNSLLDVIEHTVTQKMTQLTVSDVNFIIGQEYLDRLQSKKEIQGVYLANSLQQGFIYHSLSQGDVDDAYIVQVLWEYHTALDIDLLKKAWELAQVRFSTLRLRFGWEEELVQVVDTQGCLDWRYRDLSTESDDLVREESIKKVQQEDRQERYDLSKGPLFRVHLIKEREDKYRCILSNHHAILDGWSNPILLSFVHDVYVRLLRGETVIVDVDQSYVNAQQYLQVHKKDHKDYWSEQIARLDDRVDLSGLCTQQVNLYDYKHIKTPSVAGIVVSGRVYEALKKLCHEEGITLNAITQYVWHKILSVYGYSEKTIVGTIASGRNLPVDDIDRSVGLYINTLPLIVDHSKSQRVIDQLKEIQHDINEINIRSSIDLGSLQQGGERLFTTLFVFENYPDQIKNNGLAVTFGDSIEKLDYPLGVLVYEEDGKLLFKIQYAGELFSSDTINTLLSLANNLIEQIVYNADQLTSELDYLTSSDAKKILEDWNKTEQEYRSDKTIAELFEEQVERTPDSVAVVYNDIRLTYKELNTKANQLAHYLRAHHDVKAESLVALCLERSEFMIISILGILKAGGAYVPIDPSYPRERIDYILEDTKSIFTIDEMFRESHQLEDYPTNNLAVERDSSNLAYVIYTSGSTGHPKGVMIEQKSVVNLAEDLTVRYNLQGKESILLFANIMFDASVEQMMLALFNGHKLVVIDSDLLLNDIAFCEYLNIHKVTHVHVPPVFLTQFNLRKVVSLRRLISGGDVLSKETYSRIADLNKSVAIINEYGPTETTITATTNVIKGKELFIGRPVANMRAYILDSHQKVVPVGAIGELYLAGVGLARGYLNNSNLTLEKFIPNPFQTEEEKADKRYSNTGRNDKLYRTGDLVRYLHNGQIEYISRKDFQVKIRGYRIELGEIESALMNFEGIKQSVVLVQTGTGSSKHLVGYYVADKELDNDSIKEHLKSKLPEYMVPNALVYLEELPLTLNGKLNRKGLPKADFADSNNYKAPRNDLEMKICGIWGEVLGLEVSKVGIRDDFFRLGGDSIVSIQLVSRLRQRLNLQVNVKDIFGHRNIENLVDNVLSKNIKFEVVQVKTEQGLLTGEFGLLPIQEWFFAEAFEVSEHWNQSFLIKTPALDLERLQVSLDQLVQYHDSFRLRFKGGKQYYADTHVSPKLQVLDVRSVNDLQEHLTSWQSGFNLGSGPVASFGYLYGFDDGSARVYFALHHLIVDTVSWRILTKDLQALYEGKPLGDKGSSYRQWVEAINHYKGSSDYCWDSVFADYDKERLIRSSESHSIEITLNKDQTSTLLRECGKAYNTQINDLLLSALGRSLPHVTGSEVNHIVLEGHGREEIDLSLDVSGTLGWFTTMYPVRLEARSDIGSMIKQIKEMLRGIPYHGIGYKGELPYISFNYLGQFDASPIHSNWSIVDEKSGLQISQRNHARNIIDINGWVIDGELKLTIEAKLSEDKVSQLTRVFKNSLLDVIEHTVTQKMTQLTVSDVNFIIGQEYLDRLQSKKEIQGVYLANSLQQGFIYHSLSQGDVDDAYIVQVLWEYHTALDIDLLKKAWELAQVRFSTLRLRFGWEEELVQVVDTQGCLDWRYRDLSTESDDLVREESIKKVQQEDRQERYDLSKGPLFRVHLIKEREDKYRCILSNHHAILDGWSNPILLSFVHDVYVRLLRGETVIVDVDQSYVNAQQYLQVHKKDHKDYWSEQIARLDDRVDLSGLCTQQVNLYDYKHIKTPSVAGIVVSGRVYEALKKLCHEEGITLNAITQYVWHKILSVYGYSEKTIVGTIASGRNLPVDDIDRSVGLYINTLPLIVDHSKSQRVIDQLKEIQHDINEINIRSSIDLGSLQQGGERLFTTLFVFENYPDQIKNNGLAVTFGDSIEKLDYPLGVLVYEEDGKLLFKIQYAGELFSSDTINTLLSLANNLIEQIVYNADQLTSELDYLTSSDAKKILEDWNKTEQEYRSDKTIAELFEEQVERTPDSVAVVYNDIRLTYKELNTKANQLAHYLRAHHDVKAESLVALCLERSEFMIISILGILKAGGAYVPIDPSYPRERIDYILEDTKSIFTIDEMFRESHQLEDYPTNNLAVERDSSNLAYVIYTSGSTGHPKGVMIEQKSVVNYVFNVIDLNLINKEDIVGFSTSISFDLTVTAIFGSLLSGAMLNIFSDKLENIIAYQEYLTNNKISVIKHTPSYFELLEPCFEKAKLRVVILGGEKLPESVKAILKKRELNFKIYDEYGPTETTVGVCIKEIYPSKEFNLGKAYHNTQLYICDKNMIPVPLGAIGELYISGSGLARGYLNNFDLTSQKFISGFNNEKLYKTGDFVCWLPDGEIKYLGRKDCQVKVNGYRIELNEIEGVLIEHPEIIQCAVMTRNLRAGHSTSLIAYYVAENTINEELLIKYVQSKLPHYMCPSIFIKLDSLPLTINGKLDRNMLPVLDVIDNVVYKAPYNETQSKICEIWHDILQIPAKEISVLSDFFKLGGTSILAIRLLSKLNAYFNCNLRVVDVYANKTIESLANKVTENKHGYQPIVKLNEAKQGTQSLFMVHPGAGGCEVYSSLAKKLEKNFSCYGVDSYNLYSGDKFESLHELAKYYLIHIDKTMGNNKREYHILGWSLGGLISLEIASILEQKGITNITVYLLDTMLDDAHLKLMKKNQDFDEIKNDYKVFAASQGYDNVYIEKVAANIEVDNKILQQKLSTILLHTNVVLFKAMLKDETFKEKNYDSIYEYSMQLKYNNVEKIVNTLENIALVGCLSVSHSSILQADDFLASTIIQQFVKDYSKESIKEAS